MRGLGRLLGLGVVVAACAGESPGVDEANETETAADTSTGGGSTHGDEMSDPSGATSSEAGTSEGSTKDGSGGPFPGCGRDPGF
jgi:hypothetical protein